MAGFVQDIKLIGDEVAWLKNLREEGRKAFRLPTPKTEAWKYTKLRDFANDDFIINNQQLFASEPDVLPELDCYKISFINGIFNPLASNLPDNADVYPLIEKLIEGSICMACHPELAARPHSISQPKLFNDSFAALNNMYLQEGVYVDIKGSLDKPLMLHNHTASAENILYNLRNIINLETDAKVDFLEAYTFEGEQKSKYFGNHVNEIYLKKGAKLNHYKLQDEAFYAGHIANTFAEVRQDAVYSYICFQKGAHLARNEVNVRLLEENAQTNINAAYKMSGWATIDTTLNVEHLSPDTFSEILVKGVVGGDARGVFQGKIHIAKDAVRTKGNMLHKALLLSDTAEVDCKPELEIFADDVKCSHGAANGQLDESQLFYMQSRGIDREEAKQLLIDAYLDEVFVSIKNEDIRNWFKSFVRLGE